jgi:L-fucose mutarotase
MLKNIHPLLGPDLLHALKTIGHGDEIVIADANFPAATLGPPVIRCDGVAGALLAEAILTHLPLDTFEETAAYRMQVVDDPAAQPAICKVYQALVTRLAGPFHIATLERFTFYERARGAAYIIASGERAAYGNLILRKGVILGDAS